MLTGLFSCLVRMSELNQLPPSGFLIEPAELEAVFREFHVCGGLPLVASHFEQADFFGVGAEVLALQVDEAFLVCVVEPDALAGFRIRDEKRFMRDARLYSTELASTAMGLTGMYLSVSASYAVSISFPSGFSFADALIIRQAPYEINFVVSRFDYNI